MRAGVGLPNIELLSRGELLRQLREQRHPGLVVVKRSTELRRVDRRRGINQ
jgi:hypothetical protein